MQISIIAAVGRNRAIGRENTLLWHLPGDLPRFKSITMGHPVIMGRKTFDSIGRPLPGRRNIVVTRNQSLSIPGVCCCHSLSAALSCAAEADQAEGECFIIGGGELYAQALPLATTLYLTEVDDAPGDADTFFPDYTAFECVRSEETHCHDGLTYRFVDRVRPASD